MLLSSQTFSASKCCIKSQSRKTSKTSYWPVRRQLILTQHSISSHCEPLLYVLFPEVPDCPFSLRMHMHTHTHTLAIHACIHDMILLEKLFVIIKEPKNEGVGFNNTYRVCKSVFSRFRGENQWTENYWKIKIFKCNVFTPSPEIIFQSLHYLFVLALSAWNWTAYHYDRRVRAREVTQRTSKRKYGHSTLLVSG